MKAKINNILDFIKPQKLTRIYHKGRLLMEFESEKPQEIIFEMDTNAELLTFKNTDHETEH